MGYKDKDIFEDIKHGGLRCESALKKLYDHLRPKVLAHIVQNNGSHEEAQDVLQDAIVTVFSSIIESKFRGESSVSTFTFAVVKNQWLNRLKRKKIESKYIDTKEEVDRVENLLPSYFKEEKSAAIKLLFSSLGSACENLLIKIYYLNYSMKEIVAESIFENEQVARNKKYKCMKRLKSLVKDNVHVIDLLRE